MTDAGTPGVSVLLPVRDEAALLPAALAAIAAQDYGGPVEVLVADASNDQATAKAVRTVPVDVRVVANPGRTAGAGVNRALAVARHGIVARCDARCVLPPDYLRIAVAALVRTGAANVGGRLVPAGHTPFERAAARAMASSLATGGTRWRSGGPAGPVESVPLGVFRRADLEAVGAFDGTLARNEDYELNWRLRRAGRTVWFEPALTVVYRPRSDLRSLARQYFDYGRWKHTVLRRHPRSLRPRHLAAPALMVGLAASALCAAAGWLVGAPTLVGLAAFVPSAWVGALAGSSVVCAVREHDARAVAMALPLAAMHLAWGAGFFMPGGRGTPGPCDPAARPEGAA